ncbi:MAG: hypothetical protein H8E38_07885 [SAR324 cluster bacterium]|nr:hypothetical protein [SAR324 cluster bacterium]MBL7035928.1 hypothetical protein [SAR324 cluster bacterium]
MERTKSLKLTRSLIGIIIGMTFIILGCAQKLPKPTEEVKAILVIPSEVVNKTQIERKYDFVFNFQSKPSSGSWYGSDSHQADKLFSQRVNLQRNGKSLTIISELPPGEHRLFSMTENPNNIRSGRSKTKITWHLPFKLKEGKMQIYPYLFSYSQELIGASNWFRSSKGFVPLNDEDLVMLKKELKVYENYELWDSVLITTLQQNKKADGTQTEPEAQPEAQPVTITKSGSSQVKSSKELELDVGINSKYQLTSERSFLGISESGKAELEGSDIRFVYGATNNLSWGVRMSTHSGKDYTSTSYYSITMSENTAYVRYDHSLVDNDKVLLEAQIAAGFNLISIETDHPSFNSNTVSSFGFMLEPSIFTGMKIQDDILFGAGLNYPLDSYKGNTSWLINYNYTITKSPVIYLIFRFSI